MVAFSNNYQIKIMATGEAGGQWGDFTNENLLRIEQALGGSFLDLDITSPSGGSSYSGDTFKWLVQDTSDAFTDPGSAGRAKFVEFTASSPSTPDADQTIWIRGNTDGDKVTRIYFVKNAIENGESSIIFDNGGTDYTLLNGCYAAIYCNAAGSSVGNMLSNLQIENLTFPESAVIGVKDSANQALRIKDAGATEYLTIDSNNTRIELAQDLYSSGHLTLEGVSSVKSVTPVIDWSGTATELKIANLNASALVIKDAGGATQLTVNTTSDTITVPTLTVSSALVSSTSTTLTGTTVLADIDLSGQNTDIVFRNGQAKALEIGENTTGKMFQTFNGATDTVEFTQDVEIIGKPLNAANNLEIGSTSSFTGIATFNNNMVLGDDNYLAFSSWDSEGASYGIRDKAGAVEIKTTAGGDWGVPYSANQVTGDGTYFETTQTTWADFDSEPAPISHGLVTVPRIVQAWAKCINGGGANGYAVNDYLTLGTASEFGHDGAYGVGLYVNTSVVGWTIAKFGAAAMSGPTSGSPRIGFLFTNSDWSLVIRLWK